LLGVYFDQLSVGSKDKSDFVVEMDYNADGKPDSTLRYRNGVIARAEHDRNYDGYPDAYEWYQEGTLTQQESDDDFDGRKDCWVIYRHNQPWLFELDLDKNGLPDVFGYYQHGVVRIVVWRPNKSNNPTRLDFYEGGVKLKMLQDTRSDGLFDLLVMYDAFENPLRELKLDEPLTLNDAIAQLLPNLNDKRVLFHLGIR